MKENTYINEKDRIIFVGLDNGEKYEFAGVFQFAGVKEIKGKKEKKACWKRISKEFPIITA
jgi:hypothetical protein